MIFLHWGGMTRLRNKEGKILPKGGVSSKGQKSKNETIPLEERKKKKRNH